VQEARAAADVLAKEREASAKAQSTERMASVADAAPPQPRATDAVARSRAPAEEPKPAPQPPLESTPTAARAPQASAVTAAAPPAPARQESVAASELRMLRASFTDVSSPSKTTRWRIANGGRVEYFGAGASIGQPSDIPATIQLTAGSSPSDTVCWMVGRGGAVFLTTDGVHFTRVAFPDAVDLVAVQATDARTATATATGGRTYRTNDGGRSWQVV
jgi:hypothetical protein